MADSWNKITGNAMETPAKNSKLGMEAVARTATKTFEKIDRTLSMAETALAQFKKTTDPKQPKDGIEAIYFSECRAALSKLPEADRGREVERAIAEHDDAYASAALGGSTRLTGLGVAQQAALLAVWRAKRFPEVTARIDRLTDSFRQLDRISAMFRDWYSSIGREQNAAVKAALESEKLAREAIDAA
jgi:hypothetical protein